MPRETSSLLAGRNKAPLNSGEIRRASNVFLGLDATVSARYDANSETAFRLVTGEPGGEYGEIVFGPDIYPGSSVVDPNSALSLDAAAAHELTHYHRWRDKAEIKDDRLMHVDEALTSLQAISRYEHRLNKTDRRLLVADAILRLNLYLQEIASAGGTVAGGL